MSEYWLDHAAPSGPALFTQLSGWSSGFFGSFVVFFSGLSFLHWRFVVFFSSLGFLSWRLFGGFVVLFSSLGFLNSGFFVVLFSGLSFLNSGFFVVLRFLVVRCFSWRFLSSSGRRSGSRGGCSRGSGCWSSSCGISSESNRRQTHGSSNDQG
ncbi:hypothetical protein Q5A_019625 [Serratia inhibens PRI-2C]|nr:hypothetical protein Q5A_019625 [Serratia inhibens PRI-2C]